MGIPLAQTERAFNCCSADLPVRRKRAAAYPGEPAEGKYIVWVVLGFGGKPNPLVFARAASFAARAAQGMLRTEPAGAGAPEVAAGRLQLYVDDPAASFVGSWSSCAAAADIMISLWLVLGLPLAWTKGTFTAGVHTWIGGDFSVRQLEGRIAGVVTVPKAFADDLFLSLAPLAKGTGHVANTMIEKVLGKSGRLAFLVPSVRPFVSCLWAALAGSRAAENSKRKEAPPGRHAARRFRDAAKWIQVLLRPPVAAETLLPLEQLVLTDLPAIRLGAPTVQVDASPWGGGAVLTVSGSIVSYIMISWTHALAKQLGTSIGGSEGQTAWEYLMMVAALLAWASEFRDEGLIVMGDNVAALNGILNLRGKRGLTAITRELSWRRVRYAWRYAVAHLPAEHNLLADALSRVAAPSGSERKDFPTELAGVTRVAAPALEDLWVGA